jgi:hypothetical protein
MMPRASPWMLMRGGFLANIPHARARLHVRDLPE